MTASASIDTTGLLTILGVIAAVWALISPTNRLRLRFCTTWVDWVVGGSVFLLVHYLVFAPALEQLGLYYSLGPWKWGLDSSSAVYLLLLSVALYFFWRTRFPTLARGRVHVFRELIENLHLTRRYDELVLLVEPQLPTLISLTRQQSWLVRWIERWGNSQDELAALLRGEAPKPPSFWRKQWRSLLHGLKSRCAKRDKARLEAREILLNLVTSPELTVHLAQAHPHFCLKLLEADEAIRSDFIAHYIDALLDATGSRLYVELKNNQNLSDGSRLYLPLSNRLLRFFFADAATAVKNGLEAAVGESVRRRLDEDKHLADKLNEPLGSYQEVGRFRSARSIQASHSLRSWCTKASTRGCKTICGCTTSGTSPKRSSSRCLAHPTKRPIRSGQRHSTIFSPAWSASLRIGLSSACAWMIPKSPGKHVVLIISIATTSPRKPPRYWGRCCKTSFRVRSCRRLPNQIFWQLSFAAM